MLGQNGKWTFVRYWQMNSQLNPVSDQMVQGFGVRMRLNRCTAPIPCRKFVGDLLHQKWVRVD